MEKMNGYEEEKKKKKEKKKEKRQTARKKRKVKKRYLLIGGYVVGTMKLNLKKRVGKEWLTGNGRREGRERQRER